MYSQATSSKIKNKVQPTENPQKLKDDATLQASLDKLDKMDNNLTKSNNRLTKLEYTTKGAIPKNKKWQIVLDTEKIDVCFISETHFTKQSFIKFKGLKVYHTIHPENAAKGGSAIIVRDNIKHHSSSSELEYQTEHIKTNTICTTTKN